MSVLAMLAERGSWLAIGAWAIIGIWAVLLAAWALNRKAR